jgi:hypothetical protein
MIEGKFMLQVNLEKVTPQMFMDLCLAFYYSNRGMKNIAEMNSAKEIDEVFTSISSPVQDQKFLRELHTGVKNLTLAKESIEYLVECIMPPHMQWKNTGIETLTTLMGVFNSSLRQ